MKEKLTGKLVELKLPKPSDCAALKAVLNDKKTMESLIPYFGRDSWSDEMMRERFEKFQKSYEAEEGLPFVVIEKSSDKLVGQCGFKNLDLKAGKAEFGIILHRSTWGAGLAKECHLLCLGYGFDSLKLQNIYFVTDDHNERMKAFFQKHSIPFIRATPEGLFYNLESKDWPNVKLSLQAKDASK